MQDTLAELRATVTALSAHVDEDVEDESGQIRAHITGDRITSLTISNRWQDDVTPETLGPSILMLPVLARSAAMTRDIEKLHDQPPPPVEVAPERVSFPPSVPSELSELIPRLRAHTNDFASRSTAQCNDEPAPSRESE